MLDLTPLRSNEIHVTTSEKTSNCAGVAGMLEPEEADEEEDPEEEVMTEEGEERDGEVIDGEWMISWSCKEEKDELRDGITEVRFSWKVLRM